MSFTLYSGCKLDGLAVAFYFDFENPRFVEVTCSLELVNEPAVFNVGFACEIDEFPIVAANVKSRLPLVGQSDRCPVPLFEPDYHLARFMVEVENPAYVLHRRSGNVFLRERNLEESIEL